MGLVALDEVVEQCVHGPVEPPFALRFTLAMLYTLGEGDRAPFDAFWRACRIPNQNSVDEPDTRGERRRAIGTAYNGICLALGQAQTIRFRQDITAARRAPSPHDRAYGALRRTHMSEDEASRQRFAEMLRAT